MAEKPKRDLLVRVKARPDPADWGDDDLMTLTEAVAVFWPDGPLTVTSLRTEIRRGRLETERIAGKLLVTPRLLRDMRANARLRPRRIQASDVEAEPSAAKAKAAHTSLLLLAQELKASLPSASRGDSSVDTGKRGRRAKSDRRK